MTCWQHDIAELVPSWNLNAGLIAILTPLEVTITTDFRLPALLHRPVQRVSDTVTTPWLQMPLAACVKASSLATIMRRASTTWRFHSIKAKNPGTENE